MNAERKNWRWGLIGVPLVLFATGCSDDSGLGVQDRIVLGQLFSALDSNGDGVVTDSDFVNSTHTYRIDGIELSAPEAKEFYFGRCDSDQDQNVTRDEFFECMR